MHNIPFFFIIGRPRSGTTLLRLLFEAHPNIQSPPESPLIIALYKKYNSVKHWDETLIRELVDDLYKQMYFDKWLIDREILTNRLLKLQGESSFKAMVTEVYLSYNSLYEKEEIKMISDKNPIYSLYADRIHELFPDSKIIHITRDYRDNYCSLVKVNFEIPVVPIVVYRWKYALKKMWKIRKEHPELVYTIKYEDLASNPEHHLKLIYNFLGMEFDPKVLEFYKMKPGFEKVYAGEEAIGYIHRSLMNPISTERMNKWKKEMTPRQIKMADLVMGKTAEKAGYQRVYKKFDLGLYLWILPSLIYASLMYRVMMLGEKLPFKLRNRLIVFLGLFIKFYWRLNYKKLNPLKLTEANE